MNTKMVFTMKLLAICLLLSLVSYADANACYDKSPNCARINKPCLMGDWTKRNCFKFCGMCNRVCDLGWTHFKGDGTCLKILGTYASQRLGWHEAYNTCRSLGKGGQLVTINNQWKNNVVKGLLRQTRFTDAWIGLRNTAQSGFNWRWSYGGSWNAAYRPWQQRQPDNSGKCVTIDNNGRWDDTGCAIEKALVCQIAPFRNG